MKKLNLAFIIAICIPCVFLYANQKESMCKHENMLAIAKKHIAKKYPESNVDNLIPVYMDYEDYCIVTFKFRDVRLGGTPVVHISKKTKEVIKSSHGQ